MEIKPEKKCCIAVGMSGGVDSTVAALLLKKEGYRVIGVTMQIWDGSINIPPSNKSACFGPGEEKDIKAAENAAKKIGIPHYVVPLSKEYKQHVIEYFKEEYLAGRTPNPCVVCNKKIKFGALLENMPKLGINYDFFSTGHYASVEYEQTSSRYLLKRGKDLKKDQSYFLSQLTQQILSRIFFPLGSLTKKEVCEIARANGFADYADKDESQDFIENDCYEYIFDNNKGKPGPFIDTSGKIIGQHKGIIHYTIGQRKGLGISGFKEPLYVINIDAEKNVITVGPENALLNKEMTVENMNWIVDAQSLKPSFHCKVQIRLNHKAAEAEVKFADPANFSTIKVHFQEPQRSITPGQTAVCYHDDIVLGGGIIRSCK